MIGLKKTAAAAAAIVMGLSVSGCAWSNRAPVTGFIYTGTKADESSTSNDVGAKSGEACATSILGLVATGDASIEAAAKAGGITKISNVDSSSFSILGIYAEYCALVSGN